MSLRTLILFVSIIGCLFTVQPTHGGWKFHWSRPFALNLGRQEVGIGWSIVATLGAVGLAGYWMYKQLVSPLIVDKKQTFILFDTKSSPVEVVLRNYDCFTQFPVSEKTVYEDPCTNGLKGKCRTVPRKLEMLPYEMDAFLVDNLQQHYGEFFETIVQDKNAKNHDSEKRIAKIQVILKQQNASVARSIIQKTAEQLVNAIGNISLPENLKGCLTIDVCVHPEAFDIYQQAFTHKAQSSQSVVIRS